MLNIVTILGHVGADPIFNKTSTGRDVCNFTVATNQRWTDRTTGELQERTEWHRIVIWNPNLIAPLHRGLLVKGSQVYLEGELRTRAYETVVKDNMKQPVKGADGNPVSYTAYSTEIVLSNSSKLLVVGTRPVGAPEMAPKTNGIVAPDPVVAPANQISATMNGDGTHAVAEDIPF